MSHYPVDLDGFSDFNQSWLLLLVSHHDMMHVWPWPPRGTKEASRKPGQSQVSRNMSWQHLCPVIFLSSPIHLEDGNLCHSKNNIWDCLLVSHSMRLHLWINFGVFGVVFYLFILFVYLFDFFWFICFDFFKYVLFDFVWIIWYIWYYLLDLVGQIYPIYPCSFLS